MSHGPTGMYRFAVEACRPVANLLTKFTWSGQENFPKDQPFIIIINHVNELDFLLIMHFITDAELSPRALAKASLFKVPVVGTIFRKTKMVPVERGSQRSIEALKEAENALKNGEVIAIFPEGTLTDDPQQWPMRFKTGAARLALATGVPVIPVAHWGSDNIMQRFKGGLKHLFRRPASQVIAGPPVDLSGINPDPGDHQAVAQANQRMERALTNLVAQLRGETPPNQIWDPKTESYQPVNTGSEND